MSRFFKVFAGIALIALPVAAYSAEPVVASKYYVDTGLAFKTAAVQSILTAFQNRPEGFATAAQGSNADAAKTVTDSVTSNNTIAKANSALQAGANISTLTNDSGFVTGSFIPTSQKAAASGVASLDATTKVPIAQLPTGTASTNVAIGNDGRFWSVPVGAAGGAAPSGWATIYVVP